MTPWKTARIGILAIGCLTALGMRDAHAQDAAKVAPSVYKVVLENAHVSVLVVEMKEAGKKP